MHTVSLLNFLIGFVCFITYLGVVLGFGLKFGNTPTSKRKERRKQDVIYLFMVFSPIVFLFVYMQVKTRASMAYSLFFLILVALMILVQEYIFNRPKLNKFTAQADAIYCELKLDNQDVKYSFDAKTAKIILHLDMPANIRGNLYDLHIDRVCKNSYGEFFWVTASVRGFFEVNVKHLNIDGAKNLIRNDREVYLREFNEEPYWTTK